MTDWTLRDGGRLRRAIIRRDRYRCVICDASLFVVGVEVHHAQPKGMGGSRQLDHPENLVSLCPPCHADVHRSNRRRWTPRLQQIARRSMRRFDYP